MIRKPQEGDYLPYFGQYIDLAIENEALSGLTDGLSDALAVFAQIDEEKANYRYAEGKWSIKEILGHISDTERVFQGRALRIARGDTTSLPGFDQDLFEDAAGHDARSWEDLVEEFKTVRAATLSLLKGLPEGVDGNRTEIDGNSIALCAIPYILMGHVIHHINVLKERYEVSL